MLLKQLNLRDKVIKVLSKCKVKKHSRILVGFSGGPDSTCLLYILSELNELLNFELFTCYLDHGIRPEAELEKDILFVRNTAQNFKIKVFIHKYPHGELKKIASIEGRSIEEVAREKRYSFFTKISEKVKADFIALGHTADDHIETLIMRFFQGVNITGLAGIPMRRDNIIRPLYYCMKEEIYNYLEENSINYIIDSTNLENKYLRNKIRFDLLPVLKSIFPGYKKSLFSLSRKIGLLSDYIRDESGKKLKWKVDQSVYKIRGEDFLAAPGIIRIISLFNLVDILLSRNIRGRSLRIPFRFLVPLLDNSYITGRRIILRGYGVILLWKGNYLFFKSDVVGQSKKGYFIKVEMYKSIKIEHAGCTIRFFYDKKDLDNKIMVSLNEEYLHFPLIVRSKRPGDKIKLVKGSKSLKKLFNEWKVPLDKRWIIPVLEDQKGIIGILGKPIGFFNKFIPDIVDLRDNKQDVLTLKVTCN